MKLLTLLKTFFSNYATNHLSISQSQASYSPTKMESLGEREETILKGPLLK